MRASVLFLLVLCGATQASASGLTRDPAPDQTVKTTADPIPDAELDPAPSDPMLPPRVQAVLDGHGLDRDGLSIVVHGVGEPEPLLVLNPDVPRSPASIIKLLTSFAALDMLGPA